MSHALHQASLVSTITLRTSHGETGQFPVPGQPSTHAKRPLPHFPWNYFGLLINSLPLSAQLLSTTSSQLTVSLRPMEIDSTYCTSRPLPGSTKSPCRTPISHWREPKMQQVPTVPLKARLTLDVTVLAVPLLATGGNLKLTKL